MNANQYRAALTRLGLTQVGAAKAFGIGERTSRRWAKHGVPAKAAALLRLLLAGRITVEDVRRVKK